MLLFILLLYFAFGYSWIKLLHDDLKKKYDLQKNFGYDLKICINLNIPHIQDPLEIISITQIFQIF